MKKLIIVAVLIGLISVSAFADSFSIKNGTGLWTFYEIYVSYDFSDDWGDDQLGYDVLEPGESIHITSTLSLSSVTLDILIIDEDGDTYTIYGKRVKNGETVTITLADID